MTSDGLPRAASADRDLDAELDRLEDEVDGETVVVDRGGAGVEVVDETVVDESVVDETVVVDRSAPGGEVVGETVVDETVVVDRSTPGDEVVGETVVVDRTPAARDAGAPELADLDAPTTVVDRSRDDDSFADQDTFIVGRATADDPAPHADTVVVDRGKPAEPSQPEASVTASAPVRRRRLGGRRTLEPAPLEPIDLRSSVRAVGAGAVEYYRPRQLPEASPPPAAFDAAPPAREPSPGLPSVHRSSRRTAAITLAALTAAVAVGVIGAVTVAGLLVTG
ncbi:hypothetical protein [Agromyces silvae]|uniref:hypothetical protein n=1 Tax=Agromyces silvae TaxID=3388266 RepID=UPI00280B7DD7|nr:hypothetical protein [Agromyces protaetiae]